jgi:hypothetical protein
VTFVESTVQNSIHLNVKEETRTFLMTEASPLKTRREDLPSLHWERNLRQFNFKDPLGRVRAKPVLI